MVLNSTPVAVGADLLSTPSARLQLADEMGTYCGLDAGIAGGRFLAVQSSVKFPSAIRTNEGTKS